jgi:hypothetical protein
MLIVPEKGKRNDCRKGKEKRTAGKGIEVALSRERFAPSDRSSDRLPGREFAIQRPSEYTRGLFFAYELESFIQLKLLLIYQTEC